MFSLLLLESCREFANEAVSIIAANKYSLQMRIDGHDHMAVLDYTEQSKPDAIAFCAHDSGAALANDAELIHKIREAGCTAQILMIVNHHSREVSRVALEFDVEWVIALKEESGLLIRALQRMERKQELIHQSRQERVQRLFVDFITDKRRLNSDDTYMLFRDYLNESYFRMVVVRTLPPYRKRGIVGENTLVSLKSYDILTNRLNSIKKHMTAQNGPDVLICLIGSREELDEGRQQLLGYLQDMREFHHTISHLITWVCMGTLVENMRDISKSYQDAVDMLDERILHSGYELFEKKEDLDRPAADDLEQFEIFDVRKALTNAIGSFEELAIHKTLAQLKSNILSSTDFRGKTLFSIYKTLLSVLYRELECKEISQTEMSMDYHTAEQEYAYFWDINDMFDTLEALFQEGMRLVEKQEACSMPVPVVLAKRYIRSYFNMPLTLQEISEYVGMSENYFSDYFSKYTKMTFKQYQTDLRIRYAKQMLLDKCYKMEDISEAVGYSDVKYFSRVFKQITGIAPGEYRKKYHVAKQ